VSTTLTTDDTISIYLLPGETTPDDYVTLGALNAMPEHLLGGQLELANGTTFAIGDDTLFNYQSSLQWNHFETVDGNIQIGPMRILEHDIANSFWSFEDRADFPFPNEQDIKDSYTANKAAFDTLAASMNTTGWLAPDLSTFAPHYQTAAQATPYYFAYNGGAKPTTQGIDTVVVKIIPDTNAALLAFEAGRLDSFGSSALGANTVADHVANPDFNVFETFGISGPILLVFNLLNEHLQKRDVRYAIASVLDKSEMIKINDGFSTPTESPVWLVYDRFAPGAFKGAGEGGSDLSWYVPVPIPYNYATGRDLMRKNGYEAQDSANEQGVADDPPISEVIQTLGVLGSDLYIGFSAFAIATFALIRRRRY
jgi:ABC-type transport system substrate-binding protein